MDFRAITGAHLWAFFKRNLGVLFALAFVALLLHDVLGEHGFLAMRRTQKEVKKLRQEIQQLTEENRQLSEQIKALKTDPQAIERIAREQMGLARPGELIFKLPPKTQPSNQEQPQKKQP